MAGYAPFNWRDSRGHRWKVQVAWGVVNGRVECVAFAMESLDGKGAVTSQVVREAEQRIRKARTAQAKALARLLDETSPTGDAARQTTNARRKAWLTDSAAGHGRAHKDDLWLKRAQIMRDAVVAGRPMAQALKEAEPDLAPSTIRTVIDRTRAKDKDNGWGIAPPARRKR